MKYQGPFRARFYRLRFESSLEDCKEERIIATLWGAMQRRICSSPYALFKKIPKSGNIKYNDCEGILLPAEFQSIENCWKKEEGSLPELSQKVCPEAPVLPNDPAPPPSASSPTESPEPHAPSPVPDDHPTDPPPCRPIRFVSDVLECRICHRERNKGLSMTTKSYCRMHRVLVHLYETGKLFNGIEVKDGFDFEFMPRARDGT
ncbi:hypothetical protein U1Q18_041078 [Sarracenia purpurea var. burkii]